MKLDKRGFSYTSTDDQNLDLQKDALTRSGCDRIMEYRLSGASAARPGLEATLDYARPGNVIVVWRFDRLKPLPLYSQGRNPYTPPYNFGPIYR